MIGSSAFSSLQLTGSDRSGEGENVTDVLNAGEVHDTSLKAEPEACVTCGAVFAKIKIEFVALAVESKLIYARLKLCKIVLTL